MALLHEQLGCDDGAIAADLAMAVDGGEQEAIGCRELIRMTVDFLIFFFTAVDSLAKMNSHHVWENVKFAKIEKIVDNFWVV